jgi:hypothetical protein
MLSLSLGEAHSVGSECGGESPTVGSLIVLVTVVPSVFSGLSHADSILAFFRGWIANEEKRKCLKPYSKSETKRITLSIPKRKTKKKCFE